MRKTRAQVAHRLEVFFDALGAALHDHDRSLAARRRRPPRKAQTDAVRRLDRAGDDLVWNRSGGNGDEFHERPRGRRGLMAMAYSRRGVGSIALTSPAVLRYPRDTRGPRKTSGTETAGFARERLRVTGQG